MLIRQIVGSRAGEIIDLPFDAAMRCIEVGTALPPDAPWRSSADKEATAPSTRAPARGRRS